MRCEDEAGRWTTAGRGRAGADAIEQPAVLSPAPQVIQFPKERSGAARAVPPTSAKQPLI